MQNLSIPRLMLANDPFSQWLGIEILNVKEGSCELQMQLRQEMLNGFQIAHGGIAYSFADTALAFASNTYGKQCFSIDTSINHFEMLKKGDLIRAKATEESLKNKFGFYRVEIKRETELVALFKGTVARSQREWKDGDFE
jgi:acyl-CoA thioesterase